MGLISNLSLSSPTFTRVSAVPGLLVSSLSPPPPGTPEPPQHGAQLCSCPTLQGGMNAGGPGEGERMSWARPASRDPASPLREPRHPHGRWHRSKPPMGASVRTQSLWECQLKSQAQQAPLASPCTHSCGWACRLSKNQRGEVVHTALGVQSVPRILLVLCLLRFFTLLKDKSWLACSACPGGMICLHSLATSSLWTVFAAP